MKKSTWTVILYVQKLTQSFFRPLMLHQSNDSLVIIVDDVSPSAEGGDVDGGVLRPPAAQDLDGVKVLLSVKHRELKRKILFVVSLITKA